MPCSGASSGIGEACAWRFAEAGCKLILSARRTERLDALSKQLTDSYKVCNLQTALQALAVPFLLSLTCASDSMLRFWSSNNAHSLCQVPIHTVTLDVQDFDKVQELPGQLPSDFQEVCLIPIQF